MVENRAMDLARQWLDANGYRDVEDVSAKRSCDYVAWKDDVEHVVEVKGTTAGFGTILLTANEVELHRSSHPRNLLIVVHDIDLLEMRTEASGGVVRALEGWNVDETDLRPLSFSCKLSEQSPTAL
ncbi:protein NO VEIN domain-containing protein [Erythrobacter sp. Dej080120_24]|uniref:protein NO VEIN domain-containing protein n=1 Tax=Erythrobacter sp. Dej080120_24 TaxID=3024837 RepID=UPI00403DDC5E